MSPHAPARIARVAALLRDRVDGAVHLPGERRYDLLRQAWNRAVDPRPAVVVEAAGARDIRTVSIVAADLGLPFAPRATGHGTIVPGDGGILVSTAALQAVEVDPARRIARVGPGAHVGDVIDACQRWGLVPVAGHRTVGLAGFVLGGGIGWLSRRYGLAADGLRRATVVTCDGTERETDAARHPDLFWALRGGGGNFGVVTSLDVTLHPVTRAYGGWVAYDLAAAPDLLRRYDEWTRDAPDEATVGMVLCRPPADAATPAALRARPVVVVRAFCLGSAAAARSWLRPLLAPAGRPIAGGLGPVEVSGMGRGGGAPMARAQHTDLFTDLTGPVIDAVIGWVDAAGEAARPEVEIRHWDGVLARRPVDAGPAGRHECRFSVTAQAADAGDHRMTELARALSPWATGGTFLNLVTDPQRVATAFTPADHRRLRAIKRRYDPQNLLRLNHNIPPAEPAGATTGTTP